MHVFLQKKTFIKFSKFKGNQNWMDDFKFLIILSQHESEI